MKIQEYATVNELVAALNLNSRISDYLNRVYGDSAVMEAVTTALRIATLQERAPDKLVSSTAMAELAAVLRDAGYTYVPEDKREILLRSVTRGLSSYFDLSGSTPYDALYERDTLTYAAYYSIAPLSKDQIRIGMEKIEGMLCETEYRVLCLRFGIDENGAFIGNKTYDEIGAETGRTGSSARQIFCKAERKLRLFHNLSILAEYAISYSELNYIRSELQDELKELEATPEVKRYLEIAKSLNKTRVKICEDTPLADMQFSTRTHGCLEKAGIKTLGEIIERAGELLKIRNLGRRQYDEIAEKLAKWGFILN